MSVATSQVVNGIGTDLLRESIQEITQNSAKGQTQWMVSTHWKGGTRSDTRVQHCMIGGQDIAKNFTIGVDEPIELGGTNQYANPQEILLAGLNACMTVGYVAGCALNGIELESLRIDTEGEIDLRGFLGIDPKVKPGYENIRYKVYIKGNGTPEQFRKVHETVMKTSPNYFNLATAIPMKPELIVQ